jgi:nucleotide-binding universal stress UspA family protein
MTISRQFPFETIVVAMDFSVKSSATLRYAQAIARLHGAKLLLVHVIDPIAYAFPAGVPASLSADHAAREELNRIEEDTRRQGIGVHSLVETGNICERLLQSVRDNNGDLLVLGTRGKTETGRVALGMIARKLLAKAACPILTVTPDAEALLPWAGQWRTVVLATDFSAASLGALSSAHRIANGQLLVLHSSASKSEGEREVLLERLRFLAPFNESHTVPVEHFVTSGEPGMVIAKFARESHADLVVLGSPSRVLSEEDLLSSTVLQVISHVACPVLCIPAARQLAENGLAQQLTQVA